VAYTPRKESSWTFYIAGKSNKISEATSEILDITKKVIELTKFFFIPTRIEYSLLTYSEDVPANRLFGFADRLYGFEINPLNRYPRNIESDSGISYQELIKDINSIRIPKEVVSNIRRIKIYGKTRFVLEGKDEYIDNNSKGLYVLFYMGETFPGEQIGTNPLMIDIQQTSSKDENTSVKIDDPAYYRIVFLTYTDMWFENSSIGLANRNRLKRVLKGITDSFDVTGTIFMSDRVSEKALKEIVFGRD
jgi:hypothetical protein